MNSFLTVSDKTTKLLFQAAQTMNNEKGTKVHLSRLVILLGNGVIEPSKEADEYDEEFMWIKRKAICCQRETYVQSECTNCQKSLCEECGFSCQECGYFICNSCVTILQVNILIIVSAILN